MTFGAGTLRRGTVAAAICAAVGCWVTAAAQELPPTAAPPPNEIDGIRDYPEVIEAREKISEGDREGGLAALKEAHEKHPDLNIPQMLLAEMYLKRGQVAPMMTALDEATLAYPKHPEAFLMLANISLNTHGNLTAAGMLYEKARQLASDLGEDRAEDKKRYLAVAYSGLAQVARNRKQSDAAEKIFLDWIQLGEDVGAATYGLGQVLFDQGEYAEAYEKLNSAYKTNHTDPPPQRPIPNPDLSMGQLYANKGSFKLASKWMQRAVDRVPTDVALRFNVARWYWDYGQPDEAKVQLDELLKLSPRRGEALVLAGQLAFYERDYAAAKGHFDAALLQGLSDKDRLEAAAGQVLANYEVQDTDTGRRDALQDAVDFLNKFPTEREAAAILAWLYARQGHKDRSGAMFAKVVGDPQTLSPSAMYYIGETFHAKGEPDKARPWLEAATRSRELFPYRKDAAELLQQIGQSSP